MTHRVVILGAGYAGFTAATRLARRQDVHLTLVNRTDRFVERVRLHQLAAGQVVRDWPLARPGIDLIVGNVTGVDLARRFVHVGRAIPYDTLVYALGSGPDLSVPGAREHAFAVGDLQHALQLRSHASRLESVAVVGAGLTGIETATELASAHPQLRVSVVSPGPVGGWLSRRAQAHVERAFQRLDIAVVRDRVVKVGPDTLLLASGEQRRAATVWAAGFSVSTMAAEAGLAVDQDGRIVVDDRLRSVSHPSVYAIGDAATGTRMSCQTGLPMGVFAAKDIARTLTGRRSRPVRIRYVWQNISLGRTDGVTQFTRRDDSPLWAVMTGRASAWFKEVITRGAAWSARR